MTIESTLIASSASASSAGAPSFELPGLLPDRAARKTLRKAWAAYSQRSFVRADQRSGPPAAEFAALALLLGAPLDRTFGEVTNTVKLAHGQRARQGQREALYRLWCATNPRAAAAGFLRVLNGLAEAAGDPPLDVEALRTALHEQAGKGWRALD